VSYLNPSRFVSKLQVGNGDLTLNEQRSHFALWALLKAPLMVGADLSKLPAEGYQILLAKEVIAVNQDKLGVAGDLVWKEGPAEVGKPLRLKLLPAPPPPPQPLIICLIFLNLTPRIPLFLARVPA